MKEKPPKLANYHVGAASALYSVAEHLSFFLRSIIYTGENTLIFLSKTSDRDKKVSKHTECKRLS